jgi:hypothetical protein
MKYILTLMVGLVLVALVIHDRQSRWEGPRSCPLTIVLDIPGETADEYADNVEHAVNRIEKLGYTVDLVDR